MNKFILSLLVVLLAVVGIVYAAPTVISPVPAQSGSNWIEDIAKTAVFDLDDVTGHPTWGVSCVGTCSYVKNGDTNNLIQVNADGTVNFLSPLNWNGVATGINFTVTDSNDALTATIALTSITVTAVNDAPVWALDNEYTVRENDAKVMALNSYVTDADGETTALTFTIATTDLTLDTDYTYDSVTETFALKDTVNSGVYNVNFTVTDSTSLTDMNVVKFIVVSEDCLCEESEKGDLTIDIEDPDDGDEYKPGETIEIDATVDNNEDDELDIEIHAVLYDLDESEIVAEATSEAVEINDGDDEDITLSLEIPIDEDIDDSHNFMLFVKAYEDGQEDDYCVEDSIEIDIERDKQDVIVSRFVATPTAVNPGETVEFTVDVTNIGTSDEDDVTVKIIESDLGLNLVSNPFDLEKATDDNNKQTVRFTFTVPSNIKAGIYSIVATAYDEDDDAFDTSDNAEKDLTLTVGGSVKPVTKEVEIKVESTPSSIEAGKTYNIPVKVTNNKAIQDTFTVKLTNIDDWATSTSEKKIVLDANKFETVYLSLKANEETGEGKYSATVEVSDGTGKVVGTQTVTIGAEEEKKSIWKELDSETIFYTVGYIVIIIVAIFFIKLIFSRGKGKVKEVRL